MEIDELNLEEELNKYYSDDLIINVNQTDAFTYNIYVCLLIGACKDFEFNYIIDRHNTESYNIYRLEQIINQKILELFRRGVK